MSFQEQLQKAKRRVEREEINVLVWGAGLSGGQHYEKRKKIKEEIERTFPYADVRFSEDIDIGSIYPAGADLPFPSQELWHLRVCDVCVVLDNAQGSHEEIAHFVNTNEARKLLILTHENSLSTSSFPGQLRENKNQIFYSDEEYKVCSMVQKVIAHVASVALGKSMNYMV